MTRSISTLGRLIVLFAFSAGAIAQTITNQPQSVTVNNASTAEFTVAATNATSYQWRFNGGNLSDGPNILGSTNSTLTLEDVNSNQMGNYSVVINNSLTSSNASLTVVPGTVVNFAFSGFIGGGSSNVRVQLFDHDKPATVENFLHYVNSGAYTNMFIHRDATGFVIQGGGFGASNRTSTTAPITGWDIASQFIQASNQPTPPYPQQVDNESGVGPFIHNRFGTIAMARASSSNSATSGFFFNTADNSSSLDTNSGGYTVFGRILNGTNVLQYFNGLGNGTGIINNAIIVDNGVTTTNTFPLPVNYIGAGAPANDNLVFIDFSFPNGAPAPDTSPPTVAIASPAPGALITNALPIQITGTASDDVGLANVKVSLTPVAALDGTLPDSGAGLTNFATGTTNWTANMELLFLGFLTEPVPVGVYQLSVQSQDGAGNLSPAVTQPLTNTAIYTAGNGTVTFTAGAGASNNPIGYPLQSSTNYQILATPSGGQTFVNWNSGGYYTTNTLLSFAYSSQVFKATFISNDVGGIDFTSPINDPTLFNSLVTIAGTINTNILTPPVTVSVQIFTNATSNFAVTFPQTAVGTNTWSITESNYLLAGSYFIQALATDQAGNTTLITTNFSFVADTNPPTVVITLPANNAVVLDNNSLTIQGTAGSDGLVPVAGVNIALDPIAAPDGAVPQSNFTNGTAVGTTNWSLSLSNATGGYIAPGSYHVVATAVTGPGVTASQSNLLTISGIATNGNGTVTLAQGTNAKANPFGYPLQYGTSYTVKATAGPTYEFVNWTYGNLIVADPTWNNLTYYGGLLTANFIHTNTPRGTRSIATISYPPPNARLTTNGFLARGAIAHSAGSAQVTVQIFSLITGVQAGPILTNNGTKTWAVQVSNLAPDVYGMQVTATNSSGFSSVVSEAFEVLEFKGVAGTYNGLFLCDTGPITPTNSGFFTLSVASSGAFSGRMLFPAYRPINFNSAFSADGNSGTFNLNLPGNPARVAMALDITNGTDQLTGTIGAQNGSWSAPLICYRGATKLTAHTTPAVGKYVIGIDPESAANTNGYATLTVGAGGAMTVGGSLPDGVAFSESVKVATNGAWPVYVAPTSYKTNGVLIGWETNKSSGDIAGQLYWFKATNLGTYFNGGVATVVDANGTNYVAPAAGNYSIVFQGGSIATPMTNQLSVARAGAQFKPVTASDKLAIVISGTGVITGHLTLPGSTKPVQFKGIFLDQLQGGSGIVLDSGNQPGYFVLVQSP